MVIEIAAKTHGASGEYQRQRHRVLNVPNWKLYSENTKDTYHASILHSFLTTFHINRLSMPGGIHIDDSGGHHFSQAKLDYAAEDADYQREGLRADTDLRLEDPSVIESVDEYGDSVSVQILTVFPSMILQQIRNTIAVRVVRPSLRVRTHGAPLEADDCPF